MEIEENATDQLSSDVVFERASTGLRFANYLIDIVVFYLCVFVLALFISLMSPDFLDFISREDAGFKIADRIFSLILYAFYMSLVEAILKGRSIGKLITRTKAVYLDGSEISFGTAFSRGFSRAVPFCAFSAFGNPCNPWQDRWTDTMVIKL